MPTRHEFQIVAWLGPPDEEISELTCEPLGTVSDVVTRARDLGAQWFSVWLSTYETPWTLRQHHGRWILTGATTTTLLPTDPVWFLTVVRELSE
jgi:hypothetical protein